MQQAKDAVSDLIRGKDWNRKFYGYMNNLIYIGRNKFFVTEKELDSAIYPILKRLYDNDEINFFYPYLKSFTQMPNHMMSIILNLFKRSLTNRRVRYIFLSEKEYIKNSYEVKHDVIGSRIPKHLRIRKFKG